MNDRGNLHQRSIISDRRSLELIEGTSAQMRQGIQPLAEPLPPPRQERAATALFGGEIILRLKVASRQCLPRLGFISYQ